MIFLYSFNSIVTVLGYIILGTDVSFHMNSRMAIWIELKSVFIKYGLTMDIEGVLHLFLLQKSSQLHKGSLVAKEFLMSLIGCQRFSVFSLYSDSGSVEPILTPNLTSDDTGNVLDLNGLSQIKEDPHYSSPDSPPSILVYILFPF
ncbi:hypothetical protein RJT34_31021 [Clitoria ternatea]|uniref:Uncharacterized protein n=1 Tax=Clitoria ternatea TaxID=43366 RepID=A0AAN9EVP3_CLITE